VAEVVHHITETIMAVAGGSGGGARISAALVVLGWLVLPAKDTTEQIIIITQVQAVVSAGESAGLQRKFKFWGNGGTGLNTALNGGASLDTVGTSPMEAIMERRSAGANRSR
jgi:hypothetical protein